MKRTSKPGKIAPTALGLQVIPAQCEGDKAGRWAQNKAHWNETLDAQNLRSGESRVALATQLALFETADVREAIRLLDPVADRTVLDLGGGLGLMAILLARAGANVVIADLSPARLGVARQLAEEAGVADRLSFVCCSAEQLPFLNDSLDRATTKSVLIHTDLARAAEELSRVVDPKGHAVFIEPLDGNPFVNLYRRLAAPKIWGEITDYFNASRLRVLTTPFAERKIRYRYWLAFFATPFNYSLGWPRTYAVAERVLLALDAAVFAVLPFLRRQCWFAIVKVSGRRG